MNFPVINQCFSGFSRGRKCLKGMSFSVWLTGLAQREKFRLNQFAMIGLDKISLTLRAMLLTFNTID